MEQKHQIVLLVALLILWAGLAAWTVYPESEPARVPLVNVSGAGGKTPPAAAQTPSGARIRIDLLTQSRARRETSFTSPKNIFVLQRPEEAALPVLTGPSPDPQPPLPSPEELTRQAARTELGLYRYLGYVELDGSPGTDRAMALLAKKEVLHTARRGETIDGSILVKRITPNRVVLQEIQSKIEEHLLLDDRR